MADNWLSGLAETLMGPPRPLEQQQAIARVLGRVTPPQVPVAAGEAVIQSRTPSWRERMADMLMGGQRPSAAGMQKIQNLTGYGGGIGGTGMGAVDLTPLGMALGAQEAQGPQEAAMSMFPGSKVGKATMPLFRGVSVVSPKTGPFYSLDKDFARQFTQAGRDQEILSRYIDPAAIYRAPELPFAGNEAAMDAAIEAARKGGFRAIMVNEGHGQPNSVFMLDRSALASSPYEPPLGIRAFHGSPHDFDKFSLSKIGTGEGAQAYGHGLYFAENEGVARSYKAAGPTSNAQFDEINSNLSRIARERDALKDSGFYPGSPDWEAKKAKYTQLGAEYDALMEKRANLGHMYEVNINARPEQFLDWDKPLVAQSPEVSDRLASVIGQRPESILSSPWNTTVPGAIKNPEMLNPAYYSTPSKDFMPLGRRAEDTFREAGIPGIQYLDQGSRALGSKASVNDTIAGLVDAFGGDHQKAIAEIENRIAKARGLDPKYQSQEGLQHLGSAADILRSGWQDPRTRNYVVFDDSLIDILRKYGIAAGIMAPGAGAVLGGQQDQQ